MISVSSRSECLIRMAVGWFYLSALALFSLGSMCILSTIYWMRYWHKGFAWDGTILTFNWHPVLMVTGMVVLYSAGECPAGQCSPSPAWFMSLSGLGLWGGVGRVVSGPRCYLEEDVRTLRRGAAEKGSCRDVLGQGLVNSSIKGQRVRILGFASPVIWVAAPQLCCCVAAVAGDHTETRVWLGSDQTSFTVMRGGKK